MDSRVRNWIRTNRKRIDLSQQKLAEKVGVSQPMISKWEIGSSEPSEEEIRDLTSVFSSKLPVRVSRPSLRNWIRTNRKKTDLSQQKLAEKVGISQSKISTWENGSSEPSEEEIRILTSVFSSEPPMGGSRPSLRDWIRTSRKRIDLSQQELAAKIGVSQPKISTWEIGSSEPSEEEIRILTSVFSSEPRVRASELPLGEWFESRREQLGMSRIELAKMAGISSLAIYFIETGRTRSPREATLRSLERVLGKIPTSVKKDTEVDSAATSRLYVFVGPEGNWRYGINHSVWGSRETPKLKAVWDGIQQGDSVILYCTGLKLIIGTAIVAGKKTKNELWWPDEVERNECVYPYVVELQDLRLAVEVGGSTDSWVETGLGDFRSFGLNRGHLRFGMSRIARNAHLILARISESLPGSTSEIYHTSHIQRPKVVTEKQAHDTTGHRESSFEIDQIAEIISIARSVFENGLEDARVSQVEDASHNRSLYNSVVKTQVSAFERKHGSTPRVILTDLLNDYLMTRGLEKRYEVKGFGFYGQKVYSYVWAAITAADPLITDRKTSKYPQLYVLVNRFGIKFGLCYGYHVDASDRMVSRMSDSTSLQQLTLEVLCDGRGLGLYAKVIASQRPEESDMAVVRSSDDIVRNWSPSTHVVKFIPEESLSEVTRREIVDVFDRLLPLFEDLTESKSESPALRPPRESTEDESRLSTLELHSRFINALGEYVIRHSDLDRKPLEVDLRPPCPTAVRLYLYNLTDPPGGRPQGEHKIQLKVPGQVEGQRSSFDYSEGRIVVLAGYDNMTDVFVLWDADLYSDFPFNRNLQVKDETVCRALAGSIGRQERAIRGKGVEIVLTVTGKHLKAGLVARQSLSIQRLSGSYL